MSAPAVTQFRPGTGFAVPQRPHSGRMTSLRYGNGRLGATGDPVVAQPSSADALPGPPPPSLPRSTGPRANDRAPPHRRQSAEPAPCLVPVARASGTGSGNDAAAGGVGL